jgi:hypothetical protein
MNAEAFVIFHSTKTNDCFVENDTVHVYQRMSVSCFEYS